MAKKGVWVVVLLVLAILTAAAAWWFFASKVDDRSPSVPVASAYECIQGLPNDAKIRQKLMFAIYNYKVEEQVRALRNTNIGGVIVMNPIPTQYIDELNENSAIPLFIAVDQEGGTVQRYYGNGALASAASMASNHTVDEAYDIYLNESHYLAGVGVTVNFAPVVDVESYQPPPLPTRMYSSDPATVTEYAKRFVEASQQVGLRPVLKHFPGIGSAHGNTDYGKSITDNLELIVNRDLVPYKKLADLRPDVMVGNAITPGLSDGLPASLSRSAIDLLRDIGYQDAVVYSDSLTAAAITGSLADAIVRSWIAGVDVAVSVQAHAQTLSIDELIDSVIAKVESALSDGTYELSELNSSIERILASKAIEPCNI